MNYITTEIDAHSGGGHPDGMYAEVTLLEKTFDGPDDNANILSERRIKLIRKDLVKPHESPADAPKKRCPNCDDYGWTRDQYGEHIPCDICRTESGKPCPECGTVGGGGEVQIVTPKGNFTDPKPCPLCGTKDAPEDVCRWVFADGGGLDTACGFHHHDTFRECPNCGRPVVLDKE